jgi:hypothetical protein
MTHYRGWATLRDDHAARIIPLGDLDMDLLTDGNVGCWSAFRCRALIILITSSAAGGETYLGTLLKETHTRACLAHDPQQASAGHWSRSHLHSRRPT